MNRHRTWISRSATAVVLLSLCASPSVAVTGPDAVTRWNEHLVAVTTPPAVNRPNPEIAVVAAYMHIAMYDAISASRPAGFGTSFYGCLSAGCW